MKERRAFREANIERVKEVFTYEPEEGRLIDRRTGREITGPYRNKGKSEYITVVLDGKAYVASRIIWALHTGRWPSCYMVIDHINGDTHDDRIVNLRLVLSEVNTANSAKARASRRRAALNTYDAPKKP